MLAKAARNKRRRCAGQATIETVMAVLLLSLIFFAVVQVAYLYIARLVTQHAAFVAGRSYVVGYDDGIVRRAKEIGTIPMAGHITYPDTYTRYSPARLGAIERDFLIEAHVQSNGYVMNYEHWPLVRLNTPSLELDEVVPVRVNVYAYPVEMPMRRAYMSSDDVYFGSEVRLRNHAAFYLE